MYVARGEENVARVHGELLPTLGYFDKNREAAAITSLNWVAAVAAG